MHELIPNAPTLAVLSFAVGTALLGYLLFEACEKERIIMDRKKRLAVSAIGFLLLIPLFLTAHVTQNTAVVRNGQIVKVFAYSRVFARWELGKIKSEGGQLYSFDLRTFTVEMTKTVAPHRTITYSVECEMLGSPEKLVQYLTYFASKKTDEAREVSFHLFEFNEVHHASFEGFYNPLDDRQQAAFSRLMREYLTPRLAASGLVPRKANFKIS